MEQRYHAHALSENVDYVHDEQHGSSQFAEFSFDFEARFQFKVDDSDQDYDDCCSFVKIGRSWRQLDSLLINSYFLR